MSKQITQTWKTRDFIFQVELTFFITLSSEVSEVHWLTLTLKVGISLPSANKVRFFRGGF